MDQTEATERFAERLKPVVDSVNIGHAVEGDHPDVMIVVMDGLVLSVTVEILSSND